MPRLHIGAQDALYYEHTAPASADGFTFVFFNALTGDTNMWEAVIGPRLRVEGHGTLLYNFRGQTESPFRPGTKLDDKLVVADGCRLLEEVKPSRPVFVGLSIGGLFAARCFLKGAQAVGLVLINTLRRDGARLQWINHALLRCVEVGGMELLRDLYFPLLFNEQWLDSNRPNFLKDAPYRPIDRDSGHYNLLVNACSADWDLPYERLTLPTLVITGLQDHIFFESAEMERLFARLPNGQRIDMPDAGHMIPAERPEALADALLAFARKL